ncbi:MAG TPA: glycosyltransferase [Vicinamibacterales bacterium]
MPGTSDPLISIVVPVYNEAGTVASVIERLLAIDLPAAREIIVVNDGSKDGTREVLDAMPPNPLVTIVHAPENRGKGHAIRLGFARARGTVIAIQDADLELDPAQLATLVAPILEGRASVVYGSRFLASRPDAPRLTIVANRALTAFTNFMHGSSLTDMETCYKIMRTDVVRSLGLTADRFDIEPEITARLLLAGHEITELPVFFTPRSRAAGKKIGWRDGVVALRVLWRLRPRRALLARLLLLLCAVGATGAVALVLTGGFSTRIFGTLVRAHSAAPLATLSVVSLAVALLLGRATLAAASTWWWWLIQKRAAMLALAVAATAGAVGWAAGTHVAGGSDSYCYLNQAEMFARGEAIERQPLSVDAPWPNASWAFVPAGHAPAPSIRGGVVPICPAGYPLMMVPARAIAGRPGMFAVVPLLGALAVWLAFLLGRRYAGGAAGLLSAVMLAASPVFLYQVVQPMNDVPASALWLATLVLAWRASERGGFASALLAGLACGVALTVRPNLLPLALVAGFGMVLVRPASLRERFVALVGFGVGAVPGVAIIMIVQNAMYGSPVRSGYGDLGLLFSASHVVPNLARYPKWLLQSETPVVLLALTAPWVISARARCTWWMLAFFGATLTCYLPYVVFDAWWFLRFLLPGLAPVLVLTAAVLVAGVVRLSSAWRAPVFALLCAALAAAYVAIAFRGQVFDLDDYEARYRDAGTYVARHLPTNAAVITQQQSGSVRFYAGFPTVVWTELSPGRLNEVLEYLRGRGYKPYLLFEAGEDVAFRKRFAGQGAIGDLNWPPIADINHEVRIFDPDDAATYRSGVPVRTDRVWTK